MKRTQLRMLIETLGVDNVKKSFKDNPEMLEAINEIVNSKTRKNLTAELLPDNLLKEIETVKQKVNNFYKEKYNGAFEFRIYTADLNKDSKDNKK